MSDARGTQPKAEYPLRFPAIRVLQPLGLFYVASIPAHVLLQVAYSDVLSASLASDSSGYVLEGTQRLSQPKRLSQIADYIDRQDSAFPNSIILAANFKQDGTFEGSDDDDQAEMEGKPIGSREWVISQGPDGCYTLEIPTPAKLAAIVDGQHRLFAFVQTKELARLNMELLCSIYLDLPKPFQAQLFATINSTQKPVDKSLTYELLGIISLRKRRNFGRQISWQFFLLENSTRTCNQRFMAGSQSRRVGTPL